MGGSEKKLQRHPAQKSIKMSAVDRKLNKSITVITRDNIRKLSPHTGSTKPTSSKRALILNPKELEEIKIFANYSGESGQEEDQKKFISDRDAKTDLARQRKVFPHILMTGKDGSL